MQVTPAFQQDIQSAKKSSILESSDVYHYLMVLLMFSSAVLGSTIFNAAQVISEVILLVLLIYGISKVKLTGPDYTLLFIFGVTCIISLFYCTFFEFSLNFKIYGACILTFIYFNKVKYYPAKLMRMIHTINILLILHQFVFGHFIVASGWFFEDYKAHVNDRPVGLFLTPHATSFFIASYVIFLVKSQKQYFKSFLYFILMLITSSFTSTVALLAQLSQLMVSGVTNLLPVFRNKMGIWVKILIIVVPIALLAYYTAEFIDFLKFSSYTRYYSLEITLGQIFDTRYFTDITRLYFRNYHDYVFGQEKIFADVGNEIGLIKIFVEGGLLLGLYLLITLMRRLNQYSIFIFVSLLHYSFIINMPFMLFLLIFYNREINKKEKQSAPPKIVQ